jgi:hypothetical protein
MVIEAVVSDHMNPFRSGVARFNELLAERLNVPFVGLEEGASCRRPLLSFKASELDEDGVAIVTEALAGWTPDVFLHEFCGSELEARIIRSSRRVLAGNRAISRQVGTLHDHVDELWTPGLIVEDRRIGPAELTVFTFGMAHKIRTSMFARLRELLEASGRSYALRVSAANHETATLRDAQVVFDEIHAIFPDRLYFLGNLSDLAIVDELERATFYAAFFEGGVRANNTSVASAMERGAVVITNLDDASPPEYRHMENLIDLAATAELPRDPLVLKRISVGAMETARRRDWAALVDRITNEAA